MYLLCSKRPDLNDVVNDERAVLFTNNDSTPTPCELQFHISPAFKIAAITLVCSAAKLEVFVGITQEYLETIYGISIEEDEGDVPIRPYRYDVEIDRSGISDINLKLLTSSSEVCIFGSMLHTAPNPNGITTQLQKPFDLQKIQELLHRGGCSGSQKNSEDNEQKLQKFMCLMKGVSSQSQQPAPGETLDMICVNQHIDTKFQQLEQTISRRLDEFAAQQTEKLDRIIALLDQRTN